MLAHLCCLLVATHVLASATTASPNCSGTAEQRVDVEGWPVLVALRIPIVKAVTLNLSLSADNDVHTNLTLTHAIQVKKVGMVEAILQTRMAKAPLYTAALLLDSDWAKLRLTKRHKELELRVDSEVHSNRYSTTALLKITHHLHVDTVYCKGSNCGSFVDLQCHYSNTADTGKSNHTTEELNPSSGTHKAAYYWAFYAAISLLVLACLLFFVWRNERNKFRARWSRHSQAVGQANSSSTDQEGNTPHTGGTSDAVEWKSGRSGGRCSFAYQGPCIGDSD